MKSALEKSYQDNLIMFVILCGPTAIVAKLFEHLFLPDNYFYDSNRILEMVNQKVVDHNWYEGSYKVAVDFFRKINFFHFTEHIQWSLFGGVLLTIVVMIIFSRVKGLDFQQVIFGMMCVGLLNIYVFNISKDALQFGMFAFIYIVVSIERIPLFLRALATAGLLYWMSTIYRSYYIIMAFFFAVIFLVFYVIRKSIQNKGTKLKVFHYLFIIVGLYAMVCVFMFSARVLFKSDYQAVLEARNYSNQQGQTSVIKEPFEHNNSNLPIFLVDYGIDAIRMMFPIELVTIGVFYLPFFAFQVFMLFYTVRGIKYLDKIDDKAFIGLCVFIAFFQGSVLFEPDFGSFVRHEAATFPAIILMVFNSRMWSPKAIARIEYEKSLPAEHDDEEVKTW